MKQRFGAVRSAAAGLLLTAATYLASAATVTVTSASDPGANGDGLCTLREAINSVNGGGVGSTGCVNSGGAFGTADEIDFDIPGDAGSVQTITPTSALPPLTKPVYINGYTQGDASPNTLAVGSDAKLRIEIDGSSLPSGSILQYINTDDATIRGLVVDHLGVGSNYAWGFWINGHNGNVISGNYLQTDPTGSTFVGNDAGGESSLVVIGDSNLVGGTNPGERNVIAGGHGYGSAPVTIAGNGNVVQGNYIGVNADGTSAMQPGKAVYAIDLGSRGPAATDTLIGGSVAGAGNVIYGAAYGIHVRSEAISGTMILGNLIGTDATGSYALGAGDTGITLIGAIDTTIGGGAMGAGNVISGYSTAIHLDGGYQVPGTVVQGNKIGTDSNGKHAIGNAGSGIFVGSPSVDTMRTPTQGMIGGGNAGEGNTIAYGCGAGIAFADNSTVNRWRVLGNSIYSNNGLGITLTSSSTPLQNDSMASLTAANDGQNYPVLTAAQLSSGSVSISGTLHSASNTTFRLEFFSGIGCHPSGYGEGRNFLGPHDVMTDGNGNAVFNMVAFDNLPAGHSTFTATATDPAGNTSEFSQCFGTSDLVFGNGFDGGCAGSD